MPQTILSVDGDAAVRSLRNEVLRNAGFEIIETDTGVDALKLAVENQPTLIVLAIELPAIDGLSVCKRLKADPRTASIPVLHISSQGESHRGHPESLESGADAWLQEPVEPPVLIAVVTALIRACSGGARTNKAERDSLAKDTLSALIDSIPDEVWFADTQGRFTLANPSALREFKIGAPGPIDVEEFARSLEVYRADGSARPVEEAPPLRALRGETVRGQEEIVRTPVERELRHRQVSASPVRDAAGKIVGSVSVVRDITGRKRAEQTLRASEERYRTLFETMTEGFALCEIICDEAGRPRDYRHLAVNPAFERHAGLKAADILRPTLLEAFPEAEPVWIERYGKVALTGEPARFEAWFGPLGRCFEVSAFRTEPGRFGVVFTDITERKRAEEELQRMAGELADRAGELQTILDAAPVAIWIAHDQRCQEITGNRMADRFYEAGAEENVSANVSTVRRFLQGGRELQPQELPMQEAAARGLDIRDSELDVLLPSGRLMHMLGNASPLRDAAGQVRGCVGTFLDITDRKRAEEALRESEAVLRSLFDSPEVMRGILELVDGAIVHVSCNAAAAEMFGVDRQSITGKTATQAGAPEEIARLWVGLYEESQRTGNPVSMEYARRGADGRERWLLATASYLGTGRSGNPRFAYTILDLTDRKRAEEALRQSEERYRMLFDTLIEGFCIIEVIFDADGRPVDYRFLEINPAFEAQTGLKNARGQLMRELAPEHEAHWFEIYGQVALTGQPARFVNEAKALNRWYDVSAYRVGGPESRKVATLFNDITERKHNEERLRDAQKLESLGLLAGGVAHDFNNLLVGVIGNASLAQEMLQPDHPAAELLDGVLKSGEQAAHLTRQMLAYSGKGRFVVEPLDLSALIPEMNGLVRPSISKKIALRLDLDPDLPPVEADRGQVQQVFMNLALNAAEAIGSHEGLITVRTGVQDVDERSRRLHSETAALPPGKYVCLEVRDTGCGMDEATKAKIFDPFFSTKFVGRGLGLAAVAGILRGHKGAITVSSAPGQGSCFTVIFPAAARAAGEPVAARNAALQGAGVVLVVDDERMVREMVKRALERHGYEVLLADSGLAAIDVFKRHPGEIALVVLDLSMPHMNGEEALPELRMIRPLVKVVVSSGYGESEAMTLFKGQRVSGFIQKPYTSKGIAEKVKACLG